MFGFACLLLDRRNMQNAVHIQAHATEHFVRFFGRSQPLDQKVPHENILKGVFVLALIDLNLDGGLIRVGRAVLVRPRDWQRRVAMNDGMIAVRVGEAAAVPQVRRTEGKGRDVHQHPLHLVSGQPRGQDARAQGHAQVRVHILARLQPGQLLQSLGDKGRSG